MKTKEELAATEEVLNAQIEALKLKIKAHETLLIKLEELKKEISTQKG
jgi:hypothetical protein